MDTSKSAEISCVLVEIQPIQALRRSQTGDVTKKLYFYRWFRFSQFLSDFYAENQVIDSSWVYSRTCHVLCVIFRLFHVCFCTFLHHFQVDFWSKPSDFPISLPTSGSCISAPKWNWMTSSYNRIMYSSRYVDLCDV